SEVVHCDLHAERLEPIEDRYRAGEVANQHTLGDFEFEAARGESGLKQDRMDEPWQVAVAELDRRDIDPNGQRLRPGCCFATGLTQNPFAHRNDETALFGDRDKRAG